MDRDTLCGGDADFEEMLPNAGLDSKWEIDLESRHARMSEPVSETRPVPRAENGPDSRLRGNDGWVTVMWSVDGTENVAWKWSRELTGRRVPRSKKSTWNRSVG